MKYKNKDGISLNYTGHDMNQHLVREVIGEAIRILTAQNHEMCELNIKDGVEFLKENFDLGEGK